MLKLYYAPNTCALASLISLEETGATYEEIAQAGGGTWVRAAIGNR